LHTKCAGLPPFQRIVLEKEIEDLVDRGPSVELQNPVRIPGRGRPKGSTALRLPTQINPSAHSIIEYESSTKRMPSLNDEYQQVSPPSSAFTFNPPSSTS